MDNFIEVFRLKRREGSGEWSVMMNQKVLRNLIQAEVTGTVKGTNHQNNGKVELGLKLTINKNAILPDGVPMEK